MMPPAAKEFQQGKYTLFLVSGLQNGPNENQAESDATLTASRLEKLGIPPHALVPCQAPSKDFIAWLKEVLFGFRS